MSPPHPDQAASEGIRATEAALTSASLAGSTTRKMLPFAAALSTVISPPRELTIPWQTERPRPLPVPAGFVVKKGSKIPPPSVPRVVRAATEGRPGRRTSADDCRSLRWLRR
jgi:hypothetical protein